VKAGDKWYTTRVQISKQSSGSDVSFTLLDILTEMSGNPQATYKIQIHKVEMFLRGHPGTGVYASLHTSLLNEHKDFMTNDIIAPKSNDNLEAEDYGSGNVVPGLKFSIPFSQVITLNASGEQKNEGTVITARPVGAKTLLDSMIVCCVSLSFQPY